MTASRQQHPLQVQAESTVSTILDEHEEDGSSESRSDSPQPPQQQTGDGKIDMGESATDYSFDEEAANGLPCCIRQIAWCVFGSMIHPGDDSVTRHRKMVLSWGLGISLVGIFGGLFNLFTVGFSTNAQIVAVIAPFFLALLWIVLYVLARTTSTASAAIADIWIFFTWLGVVAISISWTDWPSDESFILLAIVACLFRTPRIPLHIMLCILGMVLSGYNLSCYSRGAPEYDLWALSDPIMRSFGRRFANSMASMFSALLVIGGLRAQMWESEQQSRHAQEQSRLVSSIANLLSRYDTARAAIVIDDAIRSDAADPEILATFKTLVENLDQYRPHLPNWMLPEAQAAAAAAVNTVPEQQSTDSDELKQLACETIDDELVSISSGTSTPKENREPSSRSTSGRRVSNLTRINSVSVSSASATNNSSTTPTTPHGHATVSANPHLRHGRTPTHTGGQPVVGHVARPAKIAHGVSVTQAVVFAKINFEVRSGATKQADLLNHLVDIVHKHAASTNAAIHSFVGDEITVTWNAAVKTLQADAKAARFLARVQKDVISEGGIAVAGGAFSGHAKVQLAGGMTGKQQQSLSVTADWITALDYLVSVGRRYASILVDPTLRENSSFACHVRAVAALEVPNWATGDRRLGTVSNLPVMVPLRRLGAYEIVDERNEHEDGEWMYVLAKVAEAAGTADTTTAKAIKTATECLDQWLRGDTAIPSVQMMDIDAWLVSQAQHGAKDSAILSEIVQAMRKSGTTTRFVRPDTFRL